MRILPPEATPDATILLTTRGVRAFVDGLVSVVLPSYLVLLGFNGLGSERSYSTKLHDPVVALSMDLDRYRRKEDEAGEIETFLHQYARFDSGFIDQVSSWDKQANAHFQSPTLLQELFVNERNFLAECSPEELEILEKRWGEDTFFTVARKSAFLLDEESTTGTPVPGFWTRPLFDEAQEELALAFEPAFA